MSRGASEDRSTPRTTFIRHPRQGSRWHHQHRSHGGTPSIGVTVTARAHGWGASPSHPVPAAHTPAELGGGAAPPLVSQALSLGQPGCATSQVWGGGGCPRSHLCDDLAILRHVDLHGPPVQGAPQDVERGRLRGRRSPWVLAPHPAPQQHPGVHVLGGAGWVFVEAQLQVPTCPAWPLGATLVCTSSVGPPRWREALGPQKTCRDPPAQGQPWSCPGNPCGKLGPAHGTLGVTGGTRVGPQGALWDPRPDPGMFMGPQSLIMGH